LVFSSYLIDIAPSFPTKEARKKPGTVQTVLQIGLELDSNQSANGVCMATARVPLMSRSLPAPWSTVGDPLLEAIS